MTLDVLAIAAHPDDVELTCGGTLIKMAKRGLQDRRTRSHRRRNGHPGTVETRAKEAAAACQIHGTQLSRRSWRSRLRRAGEPAAQVAARRKIRELRPRLSSFPTGRRAIRTTTTHQLLATRVLSGRTEKSSRGGRGVSPAQDPLLHGVRATLRPSFVVDITPHYEQRRKAILPYGSQFRPKKGEAKSKVYLGLEQLRTR